MIFNLFGNRENISMKRTYQLHDVDRAIAMIQKMIRESEKRKDGMVEVRMCFGSNAPNLDKILSELQNCNCQIELRLIISEDVVETVKAAIAGRPNIVIDEVAQAEIGLPNFVVTSAGFYMQEGVGFDDGMASFNQNTVKKYLTAKFEEFMEVLPPLPFGI